MMVILLLESVIVGTLPTDEGADANGAWVGTVVPSPLVLPSYWRSTTSPPSSRRAPMNALPIRITSSRPRGTGASRSGRSGPRRVARLGTTVEHASGEVRVGTLLADADNDNHVELCMSAPGNVAITAGSGLYEDLNDDPNVVYRSSPTPTS